MTVHRLPDALGTPAAARQLRLSRSALAFACIACMTGAALAMDEASGAVPGRLIVEVRAGVPAAAADALLRAQGAHRVRRLGQSRLHVVDLPQGSERAAVAALAARAELRWVEQDRRVPHDAANDPLLGSQWHLPKVQAPIAWATTQGEGVVLAVLDSGIDLAHPDFSGRLLPGYNFVNGNTNVADVRNHGTRTAGTAAATTGNGVGVAAVAGRVAVMPLRVSDSTGYATFSAMAEALVWAADRGARVANLSFSAASGSPSVISAANHFRSQGGLVFVSAGNTGGDQGFAPSDAFIVVSATNGSDQRTSWSSFGAYVDLAAPGEGIYTTDWNQGYASVNGTSYAAPMAAAVAALVMAANPALSAAQVEQILFSTAVDLGAAGKDAVFGHGRIDAAAAVQAALALAGPPPAPPDTLAPTVALLSPEPDAKVSGIIQVDVQAEDEVGVAEVELWAGGKRMGVASAAPYRFALDTRLWFTTTLTIEARARDAAGNVGQSPLLTVRLANRRAWR